MKGSEVSFAVTGVGESETINLDAVWTVDKLPISKESIPRQEDIARWPHLRGIMLPQREEGQVKLLVGGDVPEAFWVVDEWSLLGWKIMGPTSNSSSAPIVVGQRARFKEHKCRYWLCLFIRDCE